MLGTVFSFAIHLKLTSKSPHRRFLRLPVAKNFAEDEEEVQVFSIQFQDKMKREGKKRAEDGGHWEGGKSEDAGKMPTLPY